MAGKSNPSSTLLTVGGLCCQGDVLAAYDYLQGLPVRTKREESITRKLHDRFLVDEPKYRIASRDKWIRNVIRTYYRYYTAVLTKRVPANEGQEMLRTELNKIVSGSDLDSVEAQLRDGFIERGYHFLGGITEPFWGPYIWKTEEKTIYDVEIPSGTEQLTVYFMKDFLMMSWLEFASVGLAATGGWASDDGLYCVYDRYKAVLNEPGFTVSFLKHEAQHVADFRTFPSLAAKDLEFRAKLVELIYYPTTDKLFDFITQALDDVENAHAYAAHTIATRLSKLLFQSRELGQSKWDEISIEQLQGTALQLLSEHTEELLSGGNGI